MGQANVCYLLEGKGKPKSAQWIKEALDYVARYKPEETSGDRAEEGADAAGRAESVEDDPDSRDAQRCPVPVQFKEAPPGNLGEDYSFRTKSEIRVAKKKEARLVRNDLQWLRRKGRQLQVVLFGKRCCDGYEAERRNLIEAKSCASRESLRMAVGQLLDYAYRGKQELGELNKAVLLPEAPSQEDVNWLKSLDIAVAWPKGEAFVDTAGGQFT